MCEICRTSEMFAMSETHDSTISMHGETGTETTENRNGFGTNTPTTTQVVEMNGTGPDGTTIMMTGRGGENVGTEGTERAGKGSNEKEQTWKGS